VHTSLVAVFGVPHLVLKTCVVHWRRCTRYCD
jgi:hypothetical protein